MAINVSVQQYNGGLLPDIILLFPDGTVVTLGQHYNVGEKPIVIGRCSLASEHRRR